MAQREAQVQRIRFVSQTAIMTALIAVLTVMAFPMPPPLSTITLAPFAIFVASIFFGPYIGLVSSILGSGLGFVIAVNVGTIAGVTSVLFPVFLVGIMVARGPEGLIIGLLRRVNEVAAMGIGTAYETLAFFSIDVLYTYPILLGFSRQEALVFALLDLGTLIDLVYIIPAIIALRYLRARFKVRYYDQPK